MGPPMLRCCGGEGHPHIDYASWSPRKRGSSEGEGRGPVGFVFSSLRVVASVGWYYGCGVRTGCGGSCPWLPPCGAVGRSGAPVRCAHQRRIGLSFRVLVANCYGFVERVSPAIPDVCGFSTLLGSRACACALACGVSSAWWRVRRGLQIPNRIGVARANSPLLQCRQRVQPEPH